MGSGKWEAGMLRAALLAFALAFIPASASAQTASEQRLPPGWEFIQVQGWTFRDYTGNGDNQVLYFTMPAGQPMHIWVRNERKPGSAGFQSSRALEQVDCNARRKRIVSVTYFRRNNLEEIILFDQEPYDWTFPPPNSLGEIPLQLLCD
ncbi:surface-adhesin E family protein [Brevundimonas sp.]|uniref:surface-adhesin E family protein n=1 Tax=Brevundimonas sp. TaxID=1871086 RepID=UPI00343505A7